MRKNFPLRSIRPGPDRSPPDHFTERVLPGAHSDIGGGYDRAPDVVHYPEATISWTRGDDLEALISARCETYEQRYPDLDIDIRGKAVRTVANPPGPRRETTVRFSWTRHIDPDLSHYPLEVMHQAAIRAGVPLAPLGGLRRKGFAFEVGERLRRAVEAAEAGGPGSEAYDHLYRHWIHHSHQYAPEDGEVFTPPHTQRSCRIHHRQRHARDLLRFPRQWRDTQPCIGQ